MQSAETVLSVLRERGRRGLPCNELYRQMFNPQLYLTAVGRLASNQGVMTPGVDGETMDGTSAKKIHKIVEAMRHERYRFKPAKRVNIPKKSGGKRPLGMPSWSDKLVGEVVRLLLEAYYEPRFSDHSHGFRPHRGCHTALTEVARTWTGTTWFVEGDISQCFDSMDHSVMLQTLGEKIQDNRFLRLIQNMLRAGYLEDWKWGATYSGVPQGGVCSPVLSNIYLDRLDRFVETVLIPEHTRGGVRAINPSYRKVTAAIARGRARGDREQVQRLRARQRSLPRGMTHDPGYRRLRYTRYADDILLGFTGPQTEAEEIRQQLAGFLQEDLKLELSETKTLITHGRSQAARFLGYEIAVQRDRRSANGAIRLRVPRSVIKDKSAPYLMHGKPEYRPHLTNLADHDIVRMYGAEFRGVVQYYQMAGDVYRLNRLQWVMVTSMLKTLAAKHRTSVTQAARKYGATVQTPHGPRVCFEVAVEAADGRKLTARFGGIPLKRRKKSVLDDRNPAPIGTRRRELVSRLQASRCELCAIRTDVEIHQVRKLADLTQSGRPQPEWARIMAERRRKSLVVCQPCHDTIHQRQPAATTTE